MRSLISGLLLLLATDNHYGYSDEQIGASATSSIEYGYPSVPAITPELKAVPVAARAQAVTTLGKLTRAYVESAQFKRTYSEWAQASRPPKPTPKRPYATIFAEKKAEIDKSKVEMDATIAALPADQRKQLKQAYDEGVKQQLELFKDQKTMNLLEEQRFIEESTAYDQAMQKYPDDYRVLLRPLLQTFLSETDGVDYSAKTAVSGDKQRFVNDAFESKPDMWKRAYRAGKPATDAARAFAKDWLAALGK